MLKRVSYVLFAKNGNLVQFLSGESSMNFHLWFILSFFFFSQNASIHDSKNVRLHFKLQTSDPCVLLVSGSSSKFSFLIRIF